MTTQPPVRHNAALQKYYASLESRIGYRLFLGGTRHFGYYDSAKSSPFSISKALKRMEVRLYDALGLAEGSHVLDAGCGDGYVAIHLAQKGLRIHGIDLVESHLKKARINVKKNGLADKIQLDYADYQDLHILEENSFDGLYTMETFVHATEPLVALKEFYKVLKPGGKLALFEYDHAASTDLPSEAVTNLKIVNEHAAMPANQSFEPGVVERLMSEAGFEDIRIEDISQNIMPMLWLFYVVAYVPYLVIRLFGLQSHFINTMAAAEGYDAMRKKYTRYIIVTARKPSSGQVDAVQEVKKVK
jgi:sterol 24-C-methyltransferase